MRLALGLRAEVLDAHAWRGIFAAALTERCAPLAWHRSGDSIRAVAPPDVVQAWRRTAIESHRRGRRQLEALGAMLAEFRARHVGAVVLKGLPLARRLHGDAFTRDTSDIDLFVPAADRDAALGTLRALGWTHAEGEAPWEETWVCDPDGESLHLDLHFRLLDHNLAHLGDVPVEHEDTEIEGIAIRTHAGALVPAYLASHAAKHRLPPLLWFVDMRALWSSLDESARAAARAAARRWRLDRYLEWAVGMADAVAGFADADAAAASALGFRDGARHDPHPMLRDLRLAGGHLDRLRSAAAWAWPPPLRRDPARLAQRWLGRLRTLARRRPAAHTYGIE